MNELYALEDNYWWFKGIRYFTVTALEHVPEFQQLRQKPISILDAGCGSGCNLMLLSRYGKVFGVDFLEESVRRCRARKLTNVCQASILEIPFKKNSFDLVGCFDMLVCLDGDKDVRALQNLYEVCRPGGLLVMNLAALKILYGSNSMVTGELRRYSRSEIKAKLEQVGFKVLKLTYRNMILLPVLLVVRLLKQFQRKKTSDLYRVPGPMNSFLYNVLKLDAWLGTFFDLPVGSALFCVAQKPK